MLIKVATLLGVATFLRLCLSIFGRGGNEFGEYLVGGVTNLANIWSGAVTRGGFRRDLVWLPQISRR